MKLSALLISNFKGIGEEITILIDDIVILIGPNNCCKSTILDAYQQYFTLGSALSKDYFHNRDTDLPISITGIFTQLSDEDIETIGREWLVSGDPEFGDCAKFKVVWGAPEISGTKLSFSNQTNDWVEGGAGGWNSLLKSRLPTPVRINPNDDNTPYEKVLKELIANSTKEKLKQDGTRLAAIVAEIDVLAQQVQNEISEEIDSLNAKIQNNINQLFEGMTIGFETGVGKFKPEDTIKEASRFMVTSQDGNSSSLEHQGTGVQRAFLWSIINALNDEGLLRPNSKAKTPLQTEAPKILLLDEPEINLHPSVVKAARKAIYTLAEVEGWQVMCTTHSPIFIDLTHDHTTLIKVSNTQQGIRYFRTDNSSFSDEEVENLKMLNKCCPTVNEFFFYENSLLVEGDTEYLAYQFLIEREGLEASHCVINCRGKTNIPTFIKIFNQFEASAIAIHDLDKRLAKNGNANPMYTINASIRAAADDTGGRVQTVVHAIDFEGYYFNESPDKDKPFGLFKHITANDFDTNPKYENFKNSLRQIVEGSHEGLYDRVEALQGLGGPQEATA